MKNEGTPCCLRGNMVHDGDCVNEPRTVCYSYDETTGQVDKCPLLRIHDRHYFYCRALGDQTKPDMNPYNGGMKQMQNPETEVLPGCPFSAKP